MYGTLPLSLPAPVPSRELRLTLVSRSPRRTVPVAASLSRCARTDVEVFSRSAWASVAFAMPKSTIFTSPVKVTTMFCGEISRCTMLSGLPLRSRLSCAYARPAATPIPIASACSIGNSVTLLGFIDRTIERRSSPWMCSIAMKYEPSA